VAGPTGEENTDTPATGDTGDTGDPAPVRGPIDLIFITDVSCSMAEEQLRLAEVMPAVIDELEGVDWTATLVTTDQDLAILTTNAEDDLALDRLIWGVTMDVGRDAPKEGWAVAATTLHLNEVARPGATLSVLALSDDDDQSGIVVDVFAEILYSHADTAVYSAIVSDYPLCADATGVGTRHLEAVDLLGGVKGDVCAEDYTDFVLWHIQRAWTG
jgi:hypothetical protein